MFSKSKINEPAQSDYDEAKPAATPSSSSSTSGAMDIPASTPKAKPPASVISQDLHVIGNVKTTGDIQVEGTVEGDIRAHLLTIGESATINGEVIADDVVINAASLGACAVSRCASQQLHVWKAILFTNDRNWTGAHFEDQFSVRKTH